MKITAFNPLIVSKDPESIIKLFEEFGFEKKHLKEEIDGRDITSTVLQDANGNHVDVAKSTIVPQDLTMIRMNVDDFDETYKYLIERGFRNAQGDHVVDTGSSKSAMMISPSGFAFDLVQHIKDN